MAKQTINLGAAPTGAGGDTFRSGSAKLQANDDEIYSQLGANTQGVLPAALPVNKGGTGATTAAAARTSLGLGTAATASLTTSSNDTTSGLVMRVGDCGLGSRPVILSASQATLNTPGSLAVCGFSSFASLGSVLYGTGIQVPATANNSLNRLIFGYNKPEIYFVRTDDTTLATGQVHTINRLHTTANTTIDANGFIKAASPIVKLFADRIELNDEAEQQEIVFEKISVGDYLIKGSFGFAQEGWYVETPKDANGNVLFSVIYTTLENGDISVKTYKKKFDFETVSIVADLDNPVDITENRWIDLRLQELPQPEIEGSESIAPPEFQPTGLAQAVATVMESYHDPEQ
ncbi:phage tail fiber protein [Acinetobacter variabilis]|jgi:hypothetical protein|uniref:phage tail fiber protein n=1 Tax=Acinetobacter variabilis TaxID=70346 RepID=UPI00376F5F89